MLASGGLRDEPLLRDLVTGVLRQDGVMLEDTLPTAQLAKRLGQAVRSRVRLLFSLRMDNSCWRGCGTMRSLP